MTPPPRGTRACPRGIGVDPIGKSPAPCSFFCLKMEGGKERGIRKLMRAGQSSLFTSRGVGPLGAFHAALEGQNPVPLDAEVRLTYGSDRKPTLHVPKFP